MRMIGWYQYFYCRGGGEGGGGESLQIIINMTAAGISH